jgi:hypothetical protein
MVTPASPPLRVFLSASPPHSRMPMPPSVHEHGMPELLHLGVRVVERIDEHLSLGRIAVLEFMALVPTGRHESRSLRRPYVDLAVGTGFGHAALGLVVLHALDPPTYERQPRRAYADARRRSSEGAAARIAERWAVRDDVGMLIQLDALTRDWAMRRAAQQRIPTADPQPVDPLCEQLRLARPQGDVSRYRTHR